MEPFQYLNFRQEQQTMKNNMLAQIDTVRDESGKAHTVRIIASSNPNPATKTRIHSPNSSSLRQTSKRTSPLTLRFWT